MMSFNSSPPTSLWIGGIFGSFLLGSIPTGYLMVKFLKGVDIRQVGSGNLGATNVMRAAGKIPGFVTLAFDIFKGGLPVWLCLHFFPKNDVLASLIGLSAVCGHNWTPFLKFKGGKGVATSIGMFAAILPIPSLVALACFFISLAIWRIVSLSSLAGVIGLTLSTIFLKSSAFFIGLTILVSLMIIVLHRKNISRILKAEEPKI